MNKLYLVRYANPGYVYHWAIMLIPENSSKGIRFHAEGRFENNFSETFEFVVEENKRLISQGASDHYEIELISNLDIFTVKEIGKTIELPSHKNKTNCQNWVLNFLLILKEKNYINEIEIQKIFKLKEPYKSL